MPAWDAPVVVDGRAEADADEKPSLGAQTASLRPRYDVVTCAMYATFLLAVCVVLQQFSDLDSSVVLTLSAAVQCFGYTLLLQKVWTSRTVAGLSARSLELYALFFGFRLTSTCLHSGYIPADKSGDWVYQAFDGCSLLMVLQLLYLVHRTHAGTYLRELDPGIGMYVCLPCVVLFGCYFHADRDHNVLFDAIWQISLLLDCVALVPQLVLLHQLPHDGLSRDGLSAHYVAAVVLSRALSLGFWCSVFPEIAASSPGAGWIVVLTHAFQLLISGDFVIRYARAAVATTAEAFEVLDEM